ncbi:hypothetical protein [Roseomonas elaeocarpi]|uniref:Uncharacterized protein n=1 Tax=Roseomonas elaeocarpi TaxID=907779 RepID=A0ABV6JMP8_9PROT
MSEEKKAPSPGRELLRDLAWGAAGVLCEALPLLCYLLGTVYFLGAFIVGHIALVRTLRGTVPAVLRFLVIPLAVFGFVVLALLIAIPVLHPSPMATSRHAMPFSRS